VRDGPPTVRPAGALAQEDPKAAAKKGEEAAEENNAKDEEGAKELKEFRESGGPPPLCNGTNGQPGVDCRKPSGPPGHERIHKNGMKVPDLTPAKPTPSPAQGEGPMPGQSAPKSFAQEDPEEKEPSNSEKAAAKAVAQPPLRDGFYYNPNSVRTGLAPGSIRKNKNVKGTSSLAEGPVYYERTGDTWGTGVPTNVGRSGGKHQHSFYDSREATPFNDGHFDNNNHWKLGPEGMESGAATRSQPVRRQALAQQAPPKGTKDEIQKFIKPCIEKYGDGEDCTATGGKYWEHDNDTPLHGKASLSQYDTWTARDDSVETARIADCLKTPVGPNCKNGAGGYQRNWEHDNDVPLHGLQYAQQSSGYDTWKTGTGEQETARIKGCLDGSDACKNGATRYNQKRDWEHNNQAPLQGVSGLAQYDTWVARDD